MAVPQTKLIGNTGIIWGFTFYHSIKLENKASRHSEHNMMIEPFQGFQGANTQSPIDKVEFHIAVGNS